MSTTRGDLLRYREPVVWTAVLIGVPAWIVHLVFTAAMVQFTTDHSGWRWSLHAATAITALITVAGMVGPKRQEVQAITAGFEGADDFGPHSNRVQRPDVDDLVVELQTSAPAQDHVDLLGGCVTVRER